MVRYGLSCEVRTTQALNVPYHTAIFALQGPLGGQRLILSTLKNYCPIFLDYASPKNGLKSNRGFLFLLGIKAK